MATILARGLKRFGEASRSHSCRSVSGSLSRTNGELIRAQSRNLSSKSGEATMKGGMKGKSAGASRGPVTFASLGLLGLAGGGILFYYNLERKNAVRG